MLGMEPYEPGFEAQVRSLGVSQEGMGGGEGLRPFVATKGGQRFDPEQSEQAIDGGARIKILRLDPADRCPSDQWEHSRSVMFRDHELRRPEPGQLITHRVIGGIDAEQCELPG